MLVSVEAFRSCILNDSVYSDEPADSASDFSDLEEDHVNTQMAPQYQDGEYSSDSSAGYSGDESEIDDIAEGAEDIAEDFV